MSRSGDRTALIARLSTRPANLVQVIAFMAHALRILDRMARHFIEFPDEASIKQIYEGHPPHLLDGHVFYRAAPHLAHAQQLGI